MKKYLLLLSMIFLPMFIFCNTQYSLSHSTFGAVGGLQSNTNYSTTISVGQMVQGEVQNTDYEGYLGFLFPKLDIRSPLITSIADVPYDQGHQVQIVWNKSGYDDSSSDDNYYSIWRLDENFGNTEKTFAGDHNQIKDEDKSLKNENNAVINNIDLESSDVLVLDDPNEVIQMEKIEPKRKYYWLREDELWSFIDEIPAIQMDEYSYIAPTLLDSAGSDLNYATFRVIFHDDFEFYESQQDSGYSVDNIAPDATQAEITKNDDSVDISWDEVTTGTYQGNTYEELNGIWYKIYAFDSPNFVCDESNLLDVVTNLNFEYQITDQDKMFFKIVVSDLPPME